MKNIAINIPDSQTSRRQPMRSFAGFTLVETIVVVAIIATLAAVAIPVYVSYVNSTRQSSVDQLAQTAAAAADGYFRRTGGDPAIADLNLFYSPAEFTITIVPPNVTVAMVGHAAFTKTVPYK